MEKEKTFYPDEVDNLTSRIDSLMYRVYESAKKELSRICGWDAPLEDRNQSLYDQKIKHLINMLEI